MPANREHCHVHLVKVLPLYYRPEGRNLVRCPRFVYCPGHDPRTAHIIDTDPPRAGEFNRSRISGSRYGANQVLL
ncbi:hypothetical protein ES703_80306 [subsurface metagenome]